VQDRHELFSDEWARAWCRVLNESEAYREAGAAWKGTIALVLDPDPDLGVPMARTVRVDLAGGRCHGAATGATDEPDSPRAVIGGAPAIWRRVLAGEVDPLLAVMSGKLQLRAGSLAELMPHARGAEELVASARLVPTQFPEGWNGSNP